MKTRLRYLVPALTIAVAALNLAAGVHAQGRGRGKPEVVKERLGNYFVKVTLPRGLDEGQDRLAETHHVGRAARSKQLSLLYLFDATGDADKHARFEPLLFKNDELGVCLRWFRCGRVDLTKDDDAYAAFAKQAPLFVVFDATGKRVAETSMAGYRAKPGDLVKLLTRAAKGHAKPALPVFAKRYRSFLRELQNLDGRKRTLSGRWQRMQSKPGGGPRDKRNKLKKEEAELAAEEKKLLEAETKLLGAAAVPVRDPKAVRVGEQRRGRP